MVGVIEKAYNDVPYPSDAFTVCHPNRLATVATLLGLDPAPPDRCRVLELGCASGGNLIPMAFALPESEFVGVDLAARQVAEGQQLAQTLGLRNVRLVHRNLLDLGEDLGRFDYVIAHGVYSWVPPEVREKILALCKALLRPHGVGYISYNLFPGYNMFQMVRGMMLFHIRGIDDPLERVAGARSFMELLAETLPGDDGYAAFIKSYVEIRLTPGAKRYPGEAGLLHDELASINQPFYFREFAEAAAGHGLQFLGESRFDTMFPKNATPEMTEALARMAGSIVDYEQYLDFLSNRGFRESLVCHADAPVSRQLRPERLQHVWVSTSARPAEAEFDVAAPGLARFEAIEGAAFSSDHPLTKAAMLHLSRIAPRPCQMADLPAAARALLGVEPPPPGQLDEDAALLAANLTRGYSYSPTLVDFAVWNPPVTHDVSERPAVTALSRLQARMGRTSITTLRNERAGLSLADTPVVSLLDGTRTLDEVLDILINARGQAEANPPGSQGRLELADALRDLIDGFALAGLLIA